jgi:hypothetical protein
MCAPSIAVVVNPERRELLQPLLDALGDRSDVRVVEPDSVEGLADACVEAAGWADVVAAVGGDGSQRTAADALKGTKASLAVVPAGTANLLARVLGIDGVEEATSAITGGRRRRLDTGVVDGDTFVLNASSGFDAAVMRRVDDAAKRWGRLGYFLTGVRTLSRRTRFGGAHHRSWVSARRRSPRRRRTAMRHAVDDRAGDLEVVARAPSPRRGPAGGAWSGDRGVLGGSRGDAARW